MTDLEMTKLCAEAMGEKVELSYGSYTCLDRYEADGCKTNYDPLHDDAQAMALLKKFNLNALAPTEPPYQHWLVENKQGTKLAFSETLNRAIVECCAKMMPLRKGASYDAETKS